MAVNDLLSAVASVAPAMVSAIFNTGSPHKIIDNVRFFISYYTGPTSSMFISTMALGKLFLLKYPLKFGPMSEKHVHKVCAGIWVVSIFIPVLNLGVDKDDVIFDYRTHFSIYQYSSSTWKILLPASAVLSLIAPGVTLVVSTVLILREARKIVGKSQENLRWQGVVTVVLTAAVYMTAFLPLIIYLMVDPFIEKDPDKPGLFHIQFFRVAIGILQIQYLSNFFIYSLTVSSFRRFLVTEFNETFSLCLKKASAQGCS